VDEPVADVPAEGVEGPVGRVADLDRVDVAVESDHPLAVADPADDVAQAVHGHLVEARGPHLLDQLLRHLLFAQAEGLDLDQLGEVGGGGVAVAARQLQDLFGVFHVGNLDAVNLGWPFKTCSRSYF